MKAASVAPAYVAIYPVVAEIARSHGYALTIHGTVSRDFDLVAVPWQDKVSAPKVLAQAIHDRFQVVFGDGELGKDVGEPTVKPHNRLAWFIQLFWAGIDLSIMCPSND